MQSFVDQWLEKAGEALPADSVDKAKEGLTQWLDVYAKRILSSEEQEAWNESANGHVNGDVNGSSGTIDNESRWQVEA